MYFSHVISVEVKMKNLKFAGLLVFLLLLPFALAQSNGNDKITICHIPPGNPDNAHSITISESAVPAHLAHGDNRGECNNQVLPEFSALGFALASLGGLGGYTFYRRKKLK
jgi:hypothetical protein